ncbi:MAG TPA: prephenate dehydratase [Capillimicrobium sp.]|nr:prephenate dehydratase [Capillimicrobium sp.]
MRVGYFGPPGTFTEEALRASAPEGVERIPFPTIRATVMAVAEGAVERAVVPIENALEGSVDATLDALAVDAPGVVIVDEVVRPISHSLIGVAGAVLEEIEVVLSHPHALGQCTRFLRERLPAARLGSMDGSTAEAVRSVVEAGDPRRAAIAPRLAAELYGAQVLAEGIEDDPGNQTRFVWLARAGATVAARGDAWKTSVVFWGSGDEAPGWLVRCLSELASRDVNMTRIESRPRRMGLGHYMFFVDLEGHAEAPAVAEALRALAAHCEGLRTLGTYPAAA